MAKFTLTIETDDAGELAELAAAMADLSSPYERDEPKAEQPMEVEPGEDKPRRTRRSKAQMEADARAASAAATTRLARGSPTCPRKRGNSPLSP